MFPMPSDERWGTRILAATGGIGIERPFRRWGQDGSCQRNEAQVPFYIITLPISKGPPRWEREVMTLTAEILCAILNLRLISSRHRVGCNCRSSSVTAPTFTLTAPRNRRFPRERRVSCEYCHQNTWLRDAWLVYLIVPGQIVLPLVL